MESKVKNILLLQRGYLLIVAVILIVIIAFIGTMLVYMFVGHNSAAVNVLQSDDALCVAESGMEMAKRDVIVNGVSCDNLYYSPTKLPSLHGQYQVLGVTHRVATTLKDTIKSADTTINLDNSRGFLTSAGFVLIDNELITYTGISNDTLLGVARGAAGTIATDHLSSANVVQMQCILTATGGVPSIGAGGTRVLQQELPAASFSLHDIGGFSYVDPAMVALGRVKIAGTKAITNPAVTEQSVNFPGASILCGSNVIFDGAGETLINDGQGGLKPSSYKDHLAADVIANNTDINANNLFSYFFTQPKDYIKSSFDESYKTPDSLNGVTGKSIWYNGDLKFTGAKTVNIGSYNNPVILIVNGDFEVAGTVDFKFYGLLYVIGNVALKGSVDSRGMLVTEGTADLVGTHGPTFDAGTLVLLNLMNSNLKIRYTDALVLREKFQ